MSEPAHTRQKYEPISPYLMVHEGEAALAWYQKALDAKCTERYGHEGKLGHATLSVNGGTLMLSDEFPTMTEVTGTKAPHTLGGTTITVSLHVDDVDRWHERAVRAGATSLRDPVDEFYGRMSKVRDPYGHVWSFTGPKKS